MTKSERIENATAVTAILFVAGAMWRPAWAWLDKAALYVLVIGIAVSFAIRTDADRLRARKGVWLIPAVALAIAAQWIYFATPEEQVRTALLGAALVIVASVVAWARRRAT